jgi:translation initiation factor 1
MTKRGGLVYSTELGRTCPDCRRPLGECRCAARQTPPKGDGVVRVARETAGRKGAGVTVITGLPLGGADLAALASELKKRCGSGGTARDGRIEIQGDHRDLLVTELGQRGYRVKRVGG